MVLPQVQSIDASMLETKNDNPVSNGAVYVWGFNSFGELGLGVQSSLPATLQDHLILLIGDSNIRLQPASIRTLNNRSVRCCAAGARHSLVLTSVDAGLSGDAQLQSIPVSVWTLDRRADKQNYLGTKVDPSVIS